MTCKMFWVCALLAGTMTFSDAIIIAVSSSGYLETYEYGELKVLGNIMGAVVYINPHDVCYNLTQPPPELLLTNCFVLTKEEICSFDEMAKSAEAANYSAIIMISSSRMPVLFKRVKALFTRYNITSVLISEDSGQHIMKYFLYTMDPGSRLHIITKGIHIVDFIILVIGCVILFVLCKLFLYIMALIIQCIQNIEWKCRNKSYRPSFCPQTFPIKQFRRGDPYDTCAICLEDYKVKEKLRILPCSHAYHSKCIDPWLTNKCRTCPVCKRGGNIPGIHEEDDHDSNSDKKDSRAEKELLIGFRPRSQDHGTFTANSTHCKLESKKNAIPISLDTSKDVGSDALDESNIGELAGFRPSSSAPNILMPCANQLTSESSRSKRQPRPPMIWARLP